MCCFQDALSNCMGMPQGFPVDWLDPYGDTPLANGMESSVTIDIVENGNEVKVTSVKTPPRTGRIRLSEVLENIMGPQNGLEQADDQAKRSGTDNKENDRQKDSSDTEDGKDGQKSFPGKKTEKQDDKPEGDKEKESQE